MSMMEVAHRQQERRRRDMRGRVARVMFPIRSSFDEFMANSPTLLCRIIGHHDVEVPWANLSRADRQAGRIRFRCTRCYTTAGFTNK